MSAEVLLLSNLTAQCKRWLSTMSDRLLAIYEDARPGGFDNPDGTATSGFTRAPGTAEYWVVSIGVSLLAVTLGALVQVGF